MFFGKPQGKPWFEQYSTEKDKVKKTMKAKNRKKTENRWIHNFVE